jgi:drug/metabolite transporter (DMT)-like permease
MTNDKAVGQGGTQSLFIPLILLIGGGIAFGSIFSANRIAFEAGFPFISYSFWQSLFAGLGLLILSVPMRALPPVTRAHLRVYGLTAAIGFSVPLLALTFVAGKLPPGVISLTLTLTPSFTYLFALALRSDRWRLMSVGGIVFGLAGVLLIILPRESLGTGITAGWLLLAMAAPLGYALNNVMIPFIRPPATTSMQLSTGVLLAAALIFLPVMLIVDGPVMVTEYSGAAIWATIWAAAADVGIFLCLFEIIRRAGPVFFSQLNYVTVAASVIWAFLIFGDTFTIWVWGAIALMAVGLVCANRGANQSMRETSSARTSTTDRSH